MLVSLRLITAIPFESSGGTSTFVRTQTGNLASPRDIRLGHTYVPRKVGTNFGPATEHAANKNTENHRWTSTTDVCRPLMFVDAYQNTTFFRHPKATSSFVWIENRPSNMRNTQHITHSPGTSEGTGGGSGSYLEAPFSLAHRLKIGQLVHDLLAHEVLDRALDVLQQGELRLVLIHPCHPLLRLTPLRWVIHHLSHPRQQRAERNDVVTTIWGGCKFVVGAFWVWRSPRRVERVTTVHNHVLCKYIFGEGGPGSEQG